LGAGGSGCCLLQFFPPRDVWGERSREDLVTQEASTALLGFALWSAHHEPVPVRAEQRWLRSIGGAVGRIDGGTASGVGGSGDGVPWHGEHVVGVAVQGQ